MITSNTNGKRKTDSCDDKSPRAKKEFTDDLRQHCRSWRKSTDFCPPLQVSSSPLLLDPKFHQSASKNYSCSFIPLVFGMCLPFPFLRVGFDSFKAQLKSRLLCSAKPGQVHYSVL